MKLHTLLVLLTSLALATSCSSDDNEAKEEKVTWVNLLEGDSLELWKTSYSEEIPEAWTLKDGVLHFKKIPKTRHSDLITKKAYFDFEFKFDFKIAHNSNSGIKYRTTGSLGMEYQIIDDVNYYRDNKKPSHRTAALYELMAIPEDRVLHPAGEWNSGRIIANGNIIEHWLNGEQVLKIEYGSEDWKERFAKSKYKDKPEFATQAGSLLLQDHNDEMSFRNLFVRDLTTTNK